MRKKNLSVKVAALAMSGTLAMAPMTVRADEVGTTATVSTGTTETAAASTPAAASTAASTAAPATGTGASAPAATAGTTATTPAATTAAAGTTGTGASSAASGTTSAGTAATTGTTTAATTATAATPAAPVTVSEPAADPGTTAPNKVNDEVTDDKQGTDIHFKADGEIKKWGLTFPVHKNYNAEIKPEDTKDDKKLKDTVQEFKYTDLGNLKKDGDGDTTPFDSTNDKAKDVEKTDTYTLKAKLDVSPVHNTINAMNSLVGNFTSNGKDVYVNNLETGLRSTFTMENNLDGSFHLPTDLEDAKKHYELSSADGNPMIYRINYGKSSFAKDKVILAMDLDLTKMESLENKYSYAGAAYKNLYGKDSATGNANHVENFNHPDSDYGTYYQTSVFGNLKELVNHSAKKIQLIMKGIKFNSANGNRVESESNTDTATERITDKTVTTEGTVLGTLVGYMNADTGKQNVQGKAKFVWGAIQDDTGRDKVAGQGNDKVYLTVKFTDKEHTVTPITPVNPVQPVNPGNGGNGGNGGGDRTPIIPTVTPVVTPNENTPENPGQVLGVDRPVSVDNAVSVEEKKGEVLGATRPSTKAVATRATVSTGDNNYSALWASLFGLSLASLAGFVVLRKKEQN